MLRGPGEEWFLSLQSLLLLFLLVLLCVPVVDVEVNVYIYRSFRIWGDTVSVFVP